jgi:phosphoglycerate dehydrogenase-like enzyme
VYIRKASQPFDEERQLDQTRHNIFIATPLEPEQVDRIRAVARDRLDVVFEPDLLPPLRYTCDHNGVDGFRRTPEQERRWADALSRADILFDFPPKDPDGNGGMDLAPNVKWIQTTSSGVGKRVADLGLQESDILFTTARGVHAGPLSEFFLLGVLLHFKRYGFLKGEQAAHHWERYCGDDLDGKVLALIGAGEVGGRVGQVALSVGMRVFAMDPQLKPDQASELGYEKVFPTSELHEMLSHANVVCVCAPHTPETERMIDAVAISAMKKGVVFVNVGRGPVVDEPALIDALRSGHVAFAALDVFATEPLPEDSPLWDMPNVLFSPHSASTVATENDRIVDIFCHNLECYLDGRVQDMRNVLDKARMY